MTDDDRAKRPKVPIAKAIGMACLGVGVFFMIMSSLVFGSSQPTLASQAWTVGLATLACGGVILVVRLMFGRGNPSLKKD